MNTSFNFLEKSIYVDIKEKSIKLILYNFLVFALLCHLKFIIFLNLV